MGLAADVHAAVTEVAGGFAAQRAERQQRRHLDPADFDALADAGLLRTGLPTDRGGLFSTVAASARDLCELFRTLAHGDPSVALVSTMHPAVLAFWLSRPTVPAPDDAAWAAQRDEIFATVEAGRWWGTITSEPGSGGDVARTKTRAEATPDGWRLTGVKHFGSGSGITSYMLTTAVPDGEEAPDWFYVPFAGEPEGLELVAPWDGQGMAATQSHGWRFEGVPAVRSAWPGHLDDLIAGAAPLFGLLFAGVVLGIVETAVEEARRQLTGKDLRPYEAVEWARADLDAWTVEQAYEGGLRALEAAGAAARLDALRAKTVAAEAAESCLLRLTRVLGGGTFSRRSPFAHWFEDVRALGFLRPPWGLAHDGLIGATLAP